MQSTTKTSLHNSNLILLLYHCLQFNLLVFNFQIPNWFHYSCFFKKHKVNAYSDIGGFDSLRWDDQEKIKGKVGGGGGGSGGKGSEPATASGASDDLQVEYAKSNRSKCKNCKEQIDKVRFLFFVCFLCSTSKDHRPCFVPS